MTVAQGLPKGAIVDIRWGDQRDRQWLNHTLPSEVVEFLASLPQSLRRAMSVYRCSRCGQYGVLEGVDDATLVLWAVKREMCADCATRGPT